MIVDKAFPMPDEWGLITSLQNKNSASNPKFHGDTA